jgi:16S rRNA C967 or C1407 C5-methylase (RsmB/RsmF family)
MNRYGTDPLAELAASLADGQEFLQRLAGPFRRALRLHPRRGSPTGWGDLTVVPWHPAGRFTADHCDPGDFLDYHTGAIYPQDAASQVPVLLLDPRPGETIVDVCAAPGSKSTQIGLALGDEGLLVCSDAAAPRRRVLAENLARQGITCAVVTPMPLHVLAERHPRVADGVLVDAPCSGHEPRSARQLARMAERQLTLLQQAALLVRPGGRVVYSTCTPYSVENEGVVQAFLAATPGWLIEPIMLPGCDADLAGLGAVRLWPQRQGTEPFFACLLRAPGDAPPLRSLEGRAPPADGFLQHWLTTSPLTCWSNGRTRFAASAAAASCALPSEARGLVLCHGEHGVEPWAAQALIDRGAPAQPVDHELALRLWAGEVTDAAGLSDGLVRTAAGAPLGLLAGSGRLRLPSRLFRSALR